MPRHCALSSCVGVIHDQTKLDNQGTALGRLIQQTKKLERCVKNARKVLEDGYSRWEWFDHMRCILDHEVTFPHRLADKTELSVFEITNAPMRHVGGGRTRP